MLCLMTVGAHFLICVCHPCSRVVMLNMFNTSDYQGQPHFTSTILFSCVDVAVMLALQVQHLRGVQIPFVW